VLRPGNGAIPPRTVVAMAFHHNTLEIRLATGQREEEMMIVG
jgi:hypothetical protein